MAAFASGIFNRALPAAQQLAGAGATPMSSPATDPTGTDTSSSSSSDSSTISANDFLTLLVTEMQNQDPTADTDPNEYINQLVNVNSLEQLISINQNLSTALGTSAPTPSSPTSPKAVAATPASTGSPSAGSLAALHTGNSPAAGNLAVPAAAPAAQTVAHALDGKSRAKTFAQNSSIAQ
jgi:flagellar basal-body rod modification protein FlgD